MNFKAELQDARVVGGYQGAGSCWATSSLIISGLDVLARALATDRRSRTVIRAIPSCRTCAAGNVTPLRMIEDVERFRAEFKARALRMAKCLKSAISKLV